MKSQNSPGFSTLELVLSLLLLSPLALILGRTVHRAVLQNITILAERKDALTVLRVRGLLEQALTDLDSHRLKILPRIHKSGEITFTDRTTNPITLNRRLNGPSPESDGLTAISLDLKRAQFIRSVKEEPMGYRLNVCPSYGGKLEPERDRNLVGLSVDGLTELVLVKIEAAVGGCRDLVVARTESMAVLSNSSLDPALIRKVVPISRLYTLYVDRAGQFRYLGHVGKENIENQPIIRGLKNLVLTLKQDSNFGLTQLGVGLILSSGKEHKFLLTNHLSRTDFQNLLLNNT